MSDRHAWRRQYLAPRYWGIWFAIGCLRLVYAMPDIVQIKFGRALGALAWRLAGKRRHIVNANLAHCFPEKSHAEIQVLARDHFRQLGLAIVETARAWWGPDRLFQDQVEYRGLEHLRAAQEKHDALVVITGHFTTLEISGRFLMQHLVPFDALYRAYRNPLSDELIRRGRLRSARSLIEKSDIRRMVRSLREGVSVWYAPDQSYRRRFAAELTFFDQPAMTNTATARLVTMGKSGLIPCYCFRTSDDAFTYCVEFLPQIDVSDKSDPIAVTEATVRSLEAAIQKYPAQYFWVHRRFKKGDGLPDIYTRRSE